MATFTRSQRLLVSAAGAGLGGATLLTVLAGNVSTIADASATAADVSPAFDVVEFPICHTPVMLRLAQTEVPRAEMSAARPTAALLFECLQTNRVDELGIDEQQRVVSIRQMNDSGIQPTIRGSAVVQPAIMVVVLAIDSVIFVTT